MMTENDVIEAMVVYLESRGFKIEQALTTTEHGVDIVAHSDLGKSIFIEAKGATSSKEESNRYGRPFSKGQAFTHISVALTKSFQVLQRDPNNSNLVGIALPKDENHISIIDSIKESVKKTGLKVYFVDDNRKVVEYTF
jgi:hypothetical protein